MLASVAMIRTVASVVDHSATALDIRVIAYLGGLFSQRRPWHSFHLLLSVFRAPTAPIHTFCMSSS